MKSRSKPKESRLHCLPCLIANDDAECNVCDKPVAEPCIAQCMNCFAIVHRHGCEEDFYRGSGDGCTYCWSDAHDDFYYNVEA
jgi:hypothetical protein